MPGTPYRPFRPRRIGLVSTSRADAGIYRPLIRALIGAGDYHVICFAGGTHLSDRYGRTIREFEDIAGLHIVPVNHHVEGDTPAAVAESAGRALAAFAAAYAEHRPELLFVLGDRYEMLAAAMAAVPFNDIVLAHLHGGEQTTGAYDDACRNAITKLSHLHFAAHEAYAARIAAMGEAPWRIHTVGPLACDAMRETPPLSVEELSRQAGVDFGRPTVLVIFHPETLATIEPRRQVETLLDGIERGLARSVDGAVSPEAHDANRRGATARVNILIIEPNADVGREIVAERLRGFAARHENARVVPALAAGVFRSAMARAAVMIGNSSAGIIEAPFYDLPVINIGNRQKGRLRTGRIIDTGYDSEAIAQALRQALGGSPQRMPRRNEDRATASRQILAALSRLPSLRDLREKC